MMTSNEAKQEIVATVEAVQGCKATELIAHPALERIIKEFGTEEIVRMIDFLVKEGQLVEVEYVLSSMPYRAKSFLLPAGTTINGKNST
jgi:histidinol phosphatase-like PHP family hydrolase